MTDNLVRRSDVVTDGETESVRRKLSDPESETGDRKVRAVCCLRCVQGETWQQNISKLRLNLQFKERLFLIRKMGAG